MVFTEMDQHNWRLSNPLTPKPAWTRQMILLVNVEPPRVNGLNKDFFIFIFILLISNTYTTYATNITLGLSFTLTIYLLIILTLPIHALLYNTILKQTTWRNTLEKKTATNIGK